MRDVPIESAITMKIPDSLFFPTPPILGVIEIVMLVFPVVESAAGRKLFKFFRVTPNGPISAAHWLSLPGSSPLRK